MTLNCYKFKFSRNFARGDLVSCVLYRAVSYAAVLVENDALTEKNQNLDSIRFMWTVIDVFMPSLGEIDSRHLTVKHETTPFLIENCPPRQLLVRCLQSPVQVSQSYDYYYYNRTLSASSLRDVTQVCLPPFSFLSVSWSTLVDRVINLLRRRMCFSASDRHGRQ